ncbi:MAG TPA: glycoside hydrolase family 3 N-terminal domain-containing protein [Marmoricola sp.]
MTGPGRRPRGPLGRLRRGAVPVAAASVVVLFPASVDSAEAGPPEAPATCSVEQVVATWPLRRVAAQTLVVPVDERHVGRVAGQVADGVGGVILFGSKAPADLGADLARLQRKAPDGIVPVVMADEEGGAVQRMANLVGSMPSARRMARTMTPAEVQALARHVGGRMAAHGVTMNLAPVLDLDGRPGPSTTNPDGSRSFSIRPAVATAYGLAFAEGMRAVGVLPVVKHFPGLGHASANPDVAPAWTRPWTALQRKGLRPFRAAVDAGLPAVMVETARVPGLSRIPATLSKKVVQGVLRGQLGFDGLVVTDSLSAGAIRAAGFSVRRAAVRALEVGADLLLFNAAPKAVPATTDHVLRAIVRAVRAGDLPLDRLREAAVHVLVAKDAPVCG